MRRKPDRLPQILPLVTTALLLVAFPRVGHTQESLLQAGDHIRFRMPGSSARFAGTIREYTGRSLLVYVDGGPRAFRRDTLRVALGDVRDLEVAMRHPRTLLATLVPGDKIRVGCGKCCGNRRARGRRRRRGAVDGVHGMVL